MRLVVTVGGVDMEFVEPNVDGEYPWLVEVGSLLLQAVAGHLEGFAVNETPNVPVKLDNRDRQASRLLGYPMRLPAAIYGNDDELFFEGNIATVTYGRTLELSVEA